MLVACDACASALRADHEEIKLAVLRGRCVKCGCHVGLEGCPAVTFNGNEREYRLRNPHRRPEAFDRKVASVLGRIFGATVTLAPPPHYEADE